MKHQIFLTAAVTGLLIAGCKTLEAPTQRISWEQQQAFLKRATDPRVFGLSIYNTPTGPQIRGGGRLHPDRAESLAMQAQEPPRPLVMLDNGFDDEWPVLLDLTSSATWMEFGLAAELRARPISEGKATLLNVSGGDEIPVCFSSCSSLRLGQMFIEHPLMYVRMATGSLGVLNRDVSDGPVHAVVGWDILKKFEKIQFLYPINQVLLTTITEEYEPNPDNLLASLPLMKKAGACMVRGRVNGQPASILIDPVGDFEVAASGSVSGLQLGSELTLSNPTTAPTPGGVRLGARFLKDYQVTIRPKEGMIYFEKAAVEMELEAIAIPSGKKGQQKTEGSI